MVGAFAERTVVDQASVVVIDKNIPLDHASLVACGVPAGVGAARYRARVKRGDSVLVVGCGGDGMNVVQGAKLCGASQIIAADIVPAKCFFNVVKRIADLSRECLTGHAVDDVLVLALREFGAAAKRLP